METFVTSVDSFLPQLQDQYHLVHIETEDLSQIYLRGSILCKEEAEQFIRDFSKFTKTEWNVAYEIKTPMKCTFHKLWCCQFSYRYKASYRNKTPVGYRNKNCLANVNIFVKKVTIHTKRSDEYLRRYPPLAAIIKIKCEHSHPIDSVDFLRMRRPTEETKLKFEQYFEMGLSIPECRYLHSSLLSEEGVEDLEDAAINPTADQVAYLYKVWKDGRNNGSELWKDRRKKDAGYFNTSPRTRQILTEEDLCQASTFQSNDAEIPDWDFDIDIFGNNDQSTAQKRPLSITEADAEDATNMEKLRKLSKLVSGGEENSVCSEESYAENDDFLYKELHKRFDLMDEESARVLQYTQKENPRVTQHEQESSLAGNESRSDNVVTYFVFEPSKSSNPMCEVSDAKAIESAKTLLRYMENQNDTDLADIITVRRYLRKLRDKVERPSTIYGNLG